jgi:hypothetical protein
VEDRHFDALTRRLVSGLDRRRFGVILALLGVAAGADSLLSAKAKQAKGKDKKKHCKKNEDRCKNGKKCVESCPRSSDSFCCYGRFPKCCPKDTLLKGFCCGPGDTCCPPRAEVPQFKNGYCCNRGFECETTGENACRPKADSAGLTNDEGIRAAKAPGRGG